jgi:hypothetical protein
MYIVSISAISSETLSSTEMVWGSYFIGYGTLAGISAPEGW